MCMQRERVSLNFAESIDKSSKSENDRERGVRCIRGFCTNILSAATSFAWTKLKVKETFEIYRSAIFEILF